MWKLVSGSKLTADKEFGINGFHVRAELIKSRSSASGISCDLIYDQVNGFDNIYTNYLLLKEAGKFGGASTSYFLKGFDDIKFSQKSFKEKYLSSDKLQKAFDEVLNAELLKFIPRPTSQEIYDVDAELSGAFEALKTKLKLVAIQYEDDDTIYWENPKNGDVYDDMGDLVEFEE